MTNRIKTERESRSLSQKRLAVMAGVDARTLRKIEKGEAVLPETYRAVCVALGVEPHAQMTTPAEEAASRSERPFARRIGATAGVAAAPAATLAGIAATPTEILAKVAAIAISPVTILSLMAGTLIFAMTAAAFLTWTAPDTTIVVSAVERSLSSDPTAAADMLKTYPGLSWLAPPRLATSAQGAKARFDAQLPTSRYADLVKDMAQAGWKAEVRSKNSVDERG